MLIEGFGMLCGHDSIVESPVTPGLHIGQRVALPLKQGGGATLPY
jgi:hypothetical protein